MRQTPRVYEQRVGDRSKSRNVRNQISLDKRVGVPRLGAQSQQGNTKQSRRQTAICHRSNPPQAFYVPVKCRLALTTEHPALSALKSRCRKRNEIGDMSLPFRRRKRPDRLARAKIVAEMQRCATTTPSCPERNQRAGASRRGLAYLRLLSTASD